MSKWDDKIKQKAIKAAISMIGQESITEAITNMLSGAIDWKNKQALEPGETDIIGILTENKGQLYYAVVAVSDKTITRTLLVDTLDIFIDSQIKLLIHGT